MLGKNAKKIKLNWIFFLPRVSFFVQLMITVDFQLFCLSFSTLCAYVIDAFAYVIECLESVQLRLKVKGVWVETSAFAVPLFLSLSYLTAQSLSSCQVDIFGGLILMLVYKI